MSDVGSSLLKGARQALAYAQGKKIKAKAHKVMIPLEVDVKTIRNELDMNRKEFCESFGFSVRAQCYRGATFHEFVEYKKWITRGNLLYH